MILMEDIYLAFVIMLVRFLYLFLHVRDGLMGDSDTARGNACNDDTRTGSV